MTFSLGKPSNALSETPNAGVMSLSARSKSACVILASLIDSRVFTPLAVSMCRLTACDVALFTKPADARTQKGNRAGLAPRPNSKLGLGKGPHLRFRHR